MKVYVATRFGMWRKARRAHEILREHGHEPTSRWVEVAEELDGKCHAVPLDDPRRRDEAEVDLVDVCASDVLLLLTPAAGGTGCWLEVGVALGQGIRVFATRGDLVRERTIFGELEDVVGVSCVEEAARMLAAAEARPALTAADDDDDDDDPSY